MIRDYSDLDEGAEFKTPINQMSHINTIAIVDENPSEKSSNSRHIVDLPDSDLKREDSSTFLPDHEPSQEKPFKPRKSGLSVELILDSLNLTKYEQTFRNQEIELEDFFLLSADDLTSMKLSIGARNRILSF